MTSERTILGVDKRGMPSQTDPSGYCNFCVVLVHQDGLVSCYRGQGTPEWVADRGDWISEAEAALHFPNLGPEMKRLGMTYDRDA